MTREHGKLVEQVAWISGGASGIGQAVAELFAAEGAAVCIADRQGEQGARLANQIVAAGGRAISVCADVAHEEQVRNALEATVKEFGSLHILVNSAGVVHARLLHEYSSEEWDELMGVNVKSIFFVLKHAWPFLRRQRRSYMVNMGSISSFVAQASTPAYTASKGAVLQLSRSIAVDYASAGLRCNCICPGITDTPMLRHHLNATPDPQAALQSRLQRVPMGVAMQPADVARAALYLACEDSSGITGTTLLVDGGYLAAAEWQSPTHTAFMESP